MNPRRVGPLGSFLTFLLVAALVAIVIQIGFPRWTASGTHFGYAAGWQREIGLWNIGLAFLVVQVLLWGSVEVKRWVVRTAVLLTLMFGINHAAGLARGSGPDDYVHVLAIAFNAVAAIWGLIALAVTRSQRD